MENADLFKELVSKRTGLKPLELVCPREKSFMTPCIARDGSLAVATDAPNEICVELCVGCGQLVNELLEKEQAKHK